MHGNVWLVEAKAFPTLVICGNFENVASEYKCD
jgi:hypothetical protein